MEQVPDSPIENKQIAQDTSADSSHVENDTKVSSHISNKTTTDNDTAKNGNDTTMNGNDATKNGNDATKNGNDTTKNGNDTTMNGNDATKNGNDTTKNGNDTTKNGNDATKNGNDTTKNGNDDTKNGKDTTKNGNDTTKNGTDTVKNGNDTTKNGNDTSMNGNNTTKNGNDATKNVNDTTKNGNDATKIGNDTTKNGNDFTKNGNDSTKNGTDTTQNGNDNIMNGNDVTMNTNDTTKKRNDSRSLEATPKQPSVISSDSNSKEEALNLDLKDKAISNEIAENDKEISNNSGSSSNTTTDASRTDAAIESSQPPKSLEDVNVDKTKTHQAGMSSEVLNKQSLDPRSNANSSDFREVLLGQCAFQELPPLPKKNVRIFVSSTFTDTKEERNALMQYVYPKLEEYCRDKHGLEFQVVDMRWGVPEQASNNHTTSDLCIQEIHKCKEVSVGPNFVAIVGDKYGYRPIPSLVPVQSFHILKRTAQQLTGDIQWNAVEDWYKLDDNAVPPIYILQPISSRLPHYNDTKNPELRKEAQNTWNTAQNEISSALRKTAETAHKHGEMTSDQRQLFFMSVTENEITNGLTKGNTGPQESCFCIIRKIQDIQEHITEPHAYRFVDIEKDRLDDEAQSLLSKLRDKTLVENLPQTNMAQVEINWSTSGAQISLEKFRDIDVAKYTQDVMAKSSDVNEKANISEQQVTKHREYLNSICDAFFSNIRRLVNQGSREQSKMYDDVTSDILQHWHLAKLRCEVFEGRKDILDDAKLFLSSPSNTPLVIHGNSGCGKTSVMAKIMELINTAAFRAIHDQPFVLVARFLGTTPNTSNLHTLLVSLCAQFATVFKMDWQEPGNLSELIKDFHGLLAKFEAENMHIVLLLDSIDQLMPAYNAYKLDWLPKEINPNCHIVLSTIDEGYTILDTLKSKYENKDGKFIEVKPLGESLGFEIISKWLAKDKRTITTQQHEIVKLALEKCSLPLYARIVYDSIRRWKSYEKPNADQLMTTVRGAINHLFQTMESKFGAPIVKHSLAYLTASRYGLSEVEMEHVLSLDDTLLNSIFKFWNPPIRRIAPLLWTRVRTEVHSYIVERSADDTLVLFWYHRQFIEATKEMYLKDAQFADHIHRTLTEYFLGTWGGGKEKPFTYTSEQVTRFKLVGPKSKADRKVPLQPYVFTSTDSAENDDVERINKRRLTELPYQLLKSKNYDGLKTLVFFCYEWLQFKLKSTSAQQVIEEIELFMQGDKVMRKDRDMKLLYVNMQLIRFYINKNPNSLAFELSGRLAKYVGKSPCITELIKQCDAKGGMLLPLTTCFESANLGMMQNINYRSTEPWQHGGCFTCTEDFKTLYVIDYNDPGLPILIQYDLGTGEKVNSVVLKKEKEKKYEFTTDEYFQLELMKNGKYLLGFYRQKFIAGYTHTYRSDGLFDVIDPNTGVVTRTFEGFLFRDDFFNPLKYCTDNWVCVRFGLKTPLINITNGSRKELNRPHMLSADEKLFIMCGQKKTDMREFATKAAVGEFDISDAQVAMAASKDFSFVATMSSSDRQLRIFYLSKKILCANKRYGNIFKWKKCFNLEDKVQDTVNDLFKPVSIVNDKGETEMKTNNCIHMTLAPNDYYLMIIFRGTTEYISYLWNFRLYNARRQFIGAITPRMPLTGRYPLFNHDGSCIVFAKDKKITVLSTNDCTILNEYDMADTVKDFYTSQVSNQMLVMLKMNIVLLDITKTSETKLTVKQRDSDASDKVNVLLPSEEGPDGMLREITMVTQNETVILEEIQEPATVGNTDRISTARSRRSLALEKLVTPNGLRSIHYHSKVQLINTAREEIQYSPKKGDVLQRTVMADSGMATNESISIPGLEQPCHNMATIELVSGDRIVNEQGKVKLRVNADQAGHFKLMIVPSVISVYSVEEMKLKILKRITVYQECFLTVSNNYIVTARTKSNNHFANIYQQETGNLIATHEQTNGVECATFSQDEAQLFVVDKTLCVRVYLSPNYNSLEQKVQFPETEIPAAFVLQNVRSFPLNRNVIILCFGLQGKIILDCIFRYMHIDLVTKSTSKMLETSPALEDISKDGSIGVDLDLCIYDMVVGVMKYGVDYVNEEEPETQVELAGARGEARRRVHSMYQWKVRYKDKSRMKHLQARLTDNGQYLFYSDKRDDTLHITQLHENHATHLYTCITHAPDISIQAGLQVRLGGNVITIRGEDLCIPLLFRPDRGAGTPGVVYDDEQSRALSLVSAYTSDSNMVTTMNLDKTKSMFHKRDILLQQEPTVTDENITDSPLHGNSSKPKVLLLASNLLTNFDPNRCSLKLAIDKVQVTSTDEAITKLNTVPGTYDCIVLQQVSEDMRQLNVKQYLEKANMSIVRAKTKCKQVIVSFSPPTDKPEVNSRLNEINENLSKRLKTMPNVSICSNAGLCESGKTINRFFKSPGNLSILGIKEVSKEIKLAIFSVLGL